MIENMKVNKKRLSYSKIDCYKQCPFKYKKIHIDKDIPFKESLPVRYGNFLHGVLEDLGKAIKENDNKFPENINDIVAKSWKKYKAAQKIFDGALVKEAVDIIHNVGKKLKSSNEVILEVEKTFKMDLDENYFIQGKIDQVLKVGDRYLIRDYKTNADTKYLLADPLQLKIYAMAYSRLNNIPVDKIDCSYLMLRMDCQEPKSSFTKEEIAETEIYLKIVIREMEASKASGEYKCITSGLCPWCPAFDYCPVASRNPRLQIKRAELKGLGKVD